jgi:transcriptional regulator with XRE-family HTH domain
MSNSDTINRKNGDAVRLGETIRDARSAMGLSIRQLADAVKVHHSFIARLEAGDYLSAKPAILQRLSRVLELDERDLFALAGLEAPEGLPTFTPYLRAKYEMSDEAMRAMHDYFTYIVDKYDVAEKDTDSNDQPTHSLKGGKP